MWSSSLDSFGICLLNDTWKSSSYSIIILRVNLHSSYRFFQSSLDGTLSSGISRWILNLHDRQNRLESWWNDWELIMWSITVNFFSVCLLNNSSKTSLSCVVFIFWRCFVFWGRWWWISLRSIFFLGFFLTEISCLFFVNLGLFVMFFLWLLLADVNLLFLLSELHTLVWFNNLLHIRFWLFDNSSLNMVLLCFLLSISVLNQTFMNSFFVRFFQWHNFLSQVVVFLQLWLWFFKHLFFWL